jgi:hypothetical protein
VFDRSDRGLNLWPAMAAMTRGEDATGIVSSQRYLPFKRSFTQDKNTTGIVI